MKFKKHTIKWINILLLLIAPLIVLIFINRFSVNIPYMDQWDGFLNLLIAYNEDSLNFSHLWGQHNEHRPLFPKLIMLLLASVSHWNVVWEQYFSLFTQLCTLILIYDIARKTFDNNNDYKIMFFGLLSSFFLFSMVQYENWSWGWQLAIFLNIFSACLTVWALIRWGTDWIGFTLSLIGATIATYSFANGILIWPIILLWFLFFKKKGGYKCVLILCFMIILILISYIYHYNKPSHHPNLLEFLYSPLKFLTFCMAYIGSPLGSYFGLTVAVVFGIFGIGLIIFITWNAYINRQYDFFKKTSPWLYLIFYIILSSILTGIARSGFSIHQALYSRYTSFSLIFWIALGAILLNYNPLKHINVITRIPKIQRATALIFLTLLIGYSLSYYQGIKAFRSHFTRLSDIHFLLHHDKYYGTDKQLAILYPSLSKIYVAIEKLRQLGIGPFHREILRPKGVYIGWSYVGEALGLPDSLLIQDDALLLKGNKCLSFEIEIPQNGYYYFSAELGSNEEDGVISIRLDDKVLGETENKKPKTIISPKLFEWIYYDTIKLTKGLHKVSLKNIRGTNFIRAISLKETLLNNTN